MRKTQSLTLVLAGSLALLLQGWLMAGEEASGIIAVAGVSEGLRQSPDLYVAAVLEIVGEPECSDPKSPPTCVEKAKLLEVLASHGGDFKIGGVIATNTVGAVGSRYVGFFVPMPGQSNVYGA